MFPVDTLSDTQTRSIPADTDRTRQPLHQSVISLDDYYSHLSAETSVTAAALELTGLTPGPHGTASLPAADPSVAWLTLTGIGGNAGSVLAVHAQWDTLITISARLGEPLATGLH